MLLLAVGHICPLVFTKKVNGEPVFVASYIHSYTYLNFIKLLVHWLLDPGQVGLELTFLQLGSITNYVLCIAGVLGTCRYEAAKTHVSQSNTAVLCRVSTNKPETIA